MTQINLHKDRVSAPRTPIRQESVPEKERYDVKYYTRRKKRTVDDLAEDLIIYKDGIGQGKLAFPSASTNQEKGVGRKRRKHDLQNERKLSLRSNARVLRPRMEVGIRKKNISQPKAVIPPTTPKRVGKKTVQEQNVVSEGKRRGVRKGIMNSAVVKYKSQRLRILGGRSKNHKKAGKAHDNRQLMIVPYNRPLLHPSSGNHSKPKVDLDEKTTKKWKMLKENSADEGNDEVDQGEEKWWEQERELFHECARTFISYMHIIQGDKRFSQWKGSVLDSVLGVFLTQNTSDHLSSFAFMSLAAKYPHMREKSPCGMSFGPTCIQSCSSKNGRKNEKALVNRTIIKGKREKAKKKATKQVKAEASKSIRRKKGSDKTDWNTLKKSYAKDNVEKKSDETLDALDWNTVRKADIDDIAKAITIGGMEKKLAARIKNCLIRLEKEHGSSDLEWLRDVPGAKAKEYLLSMYGLGLKSVECVRLLTLRQRAFPVDTNIGRIAVRLGWIPLRPLPEGFEFHRLKAYPQVNSIHKYLWPRFCKLDWFTLYELHCQMIAFGKVFCTKRNPNCNACPMRAGCKYFASAFTSRQLALDGKQENDEIHSDNTIALERSRRLSKAILPLESAKNQEISESAIVPLLEISSADPRIASKSRNSPSKCEHITDLEESKGLGFTEPLAVDIEDFDFCGIPKIELNISKFRETLRTYFNENKVLLQDSGMTKHLMVMSPDIASVPVVQLKNKNHLRTDHQVYVLPDSHYLLAKLDQRVPNESSPYLLIIWENLDKEHSTDCTAQEDKVWGTILIPSRTAVGGRFPLNGTYFQPNEVFADDESSRVPIQVLREQLVDLPRMTLYCGNAVTAIFRGMNTRQIQKCFWRGFICLRGFDRASREPKPLPSRFHLRSSKSSRNMREDEGRAENESSMHNMN